MTAAEGLLILAIEDRGIMVNVRLNRDGEFRGKVYDEGGNVLISTDISLRLEDAIEWYASMLLKLEAGELHAYSRLRNKEIPAWLS